MAPAPPASRSRRREDIVLRAWDEMVGDDTARFCCICIKTVYDLSAMSSDDACAAVCANPSTRRRARLDVRVPGGPDLDEPEAATRAAVARMSMGGMVLAAEPHANDPGAYDVDRALRSDESTRVRDVNAL